MSSELTNIQCCLLPFLTVSHRWIMRLDAQFGSGKGWTLESQMVKLPERASPAEGDLFIGLTYRGEPEIMNDACRP